MTEEQLVKLEERVNMLIDSHARLRSEVASLKAERREMLERDSQLRRRLETVLERIRVLEMEPEA